MCVKSLTSLTDKISTTSTEEMREMNCLPRSEDWNNICISLVPSVRNSCIPHLKKLSYTSPPSYPKGFVLVYCEYWPIPDTRIYFLSFLTKLIVNFARLVVAQRNKCFERQDAERNSEYVYAGTCRRQYPNFSGNATIKALSMF